MKRYKNDIGDPVIEGENICAVFITDDDEKITRYGVHTMVDWGDFWIVKGRDFCDRIEGELYWAKENADYWATL